MIIHLLTIDHFVAGFVANLKKMGYWDTNTVIYIGHNKSQFEKIGVTCISDKRDVVKYMRKHAPRKVVAHFLGPQSAWVINHIDKDIEVTWLFYGGEFFNRGEMYFTHLATEQRRHFYAHYKSLLNFANRTYQRFEYFLYRSLGITNNFIKALNRVNTMAHWIEEDWRQVVEKYQLKNLKFLPFYYSTPIPRIESNAERTYMLIGNSGAFTNNHLRILEGMSESFADQFEKIVLPVSYGVSPMYLKILKRAAAPFGDRIWLLTKFMPKEEYFAILNKVRLAVFPSGRSQGGNNIRWSFIHEVDVALHPDNNMVGFYTSKGLKFHLISDELLTTKTQFLSQEILESNSHRIQDSLGDDMRSQSFQRLLQ